MPEKRQVRAVIIGAGGLGTPVALELIRSRPEDEELTLVIVDHDRVERSNLNRQICFEPADIGRPKAEALAERLSARVTGGGVSIEPQVTRFSEENGAALLDGASCLLDCSDDIPTKFLANDLAVLLRIPFCYGGAVELRGMCLAVTGGERRGGCLRCLFGSEAEKLLESEFQSCQTAGILGPVAGIIGTVQAQLIRNILSRSAVSPDCSQEEGSIFTRFSAHDLTWHSAPIPAASDCPLGCGITPDSAIDLRGHSCPYTFLYTKLALEKLPCGGKLEVRFGSCESRENVSRSVREEGHELLFSVSAFAEERIVIRKQPGGR